MITTLKEAVARLRAVLRTRALDREFEQELESHLVMLTDDNIRLGMAPDEARRAASLRVGNVASMKDQHREIRGLPWVEPLFQDVRFAARRLMKDRWFTLAAVTALALGIGANSAVFTLVNAVLLRSLPFDDPDRIARIDTHDVRGRLSGVSLQDFEDWRRASRTFSGMTLSAGLNLAISAGDEGAQNYPGGYISANAFDLIGVQTILGRGFVPADDEAGAPPVVLISGSIWKSRFASDPAVIGRVIRINALPVTVIGVMPDGFTWPFQHQIWIPMSQLPPTTRARGRAFRVYTAYGRLADGATLEQARSEMTNISGQLAIEYPDTNNGITEEVTHFSEHVVGTGFRTVLWSLTGAVAFVLLIACSNVANLLLARAAHRSREIAVCVALGATRCRIVCQLLAESVLLAFISGIVGLGFAFILVRWFDRESQDVGRAYWMDFSIDGSVLAFFVAICLVTGIVFGLAPALHLSKTNVNEAVKEGGRSGAGNLRVRRLTAALIVTELTLTLVLLTAAGLMMRSFMNMYRRDVGIETSGLLTMRFGLPPRKYPNLTTRIDFIRRMEERLNSVGEVISASTTTNTPMFGGAARVLAIDGKPAKPGDNHPIVTVLSVGPRYFDALGVHIVRGRPLEANDGMPGREVAIINRRLASMYFDNEDPIGQRIRLTDETSASLKYEWATIVGVAPNVRQRSADNDPQPDPVIYLPHLQNPAPLQLSIIVRGKAEPEQLTRLLRKEMFALDQDVSLSDVSTLDESLAQQRWFFRVFGTMFSIFAGIAIVLAAVGLFAVTAYSVSHRTQEIGLRMALGARTGQVVWLILRRSLLHLVVGLALGLAGAVAVGKLLQRMLFQTEPSDPLTLVSVTVLLIVVAISASLWPAWRASCLDPVMALRYE